MRTSNDNIFVTGDSVYYKRASDRRWRGPAKVLTKDGQQVLVIHDGTYVLCHPCRLSLEQSNQHQQFPQAQTTSVNNSENDSDTSTFGITEPPVQKLIATNTSVASSDSENERTDNYETLKQSKEMKLSDAEDLSLSLPSQMSALPKKASNVNKEPKKGIIIRLKTDKQNSWKQVKVLSRAGKVGKNKSGKCKNHWNVLDDQGYAKVIDFENDVKECKEIKSDYDGETK